MRSGRRSSIFAPRFAASGRLFGRSLICGEQKGLFHERDCGGVGNFGGRRKVEIVARQDGAPRFDALRGEGADEVQEDRSCPQRIARGRTRAQRRYPAREKPQCGLRFRRTTSGPDQLLLINSGR